MDMKLRNASAFILASLWTSVLQAADPQLLSLVMPDAKVLAGINVSQAKSSPFGQFLITQAVNNQHLSEIIAKTGFDPTRDLDELLLASNGAASNPSHLVLARGNFNAGIAAAATTAGATSEVYNGVTIFANPKRGDAFAFLNPTLAVAGAVADVKGAIDRQTAPTTLGAVLMGPVNQWSVVEGEDAWFVSLVPPPAFKPPANAPNVPAIPSTVFQNVQEAQGGVKFGTEVVLSAQLQADTAQNATAMANVLLFFVNLGQMQAQQNSQAAAALKFVTISTSGQNVNVSANVPEAQVEAVIQSQAQPKVERRQGPRPQRRL
jgi:hypothetical protein